METHRNRQKASKHTRRVERAEVNDTSWKAREMSRLSSRSVLFIWAEHAKKEGISFFRSFYCSALLCCVCSPWHTRLASNFLPYKECLLLGLTRARVHRKSEWELTGVEGLEESQSWQVNQSQMRAMLLLLMECVNNEDSLSPSSLSPNAI